MSELHQTEAIKSAHTSCGPSASAQPTGHCTGLAGPHGAYDSSQAVFHRAAQLL